MLPYRTLTRVPYSSEYQLCIASLDALRETQDNPPPLSLFVFVSIVSFTIAFI